MAATSAKGPTLRESDRMAGAVGLWCRDCKSVLPKSPYWPLNKTKGLHESGTAPNSVYPNRKRHRVKYLHLA